MQCVSQVNVVSANTENYAAQHRAYCLLGRSQTLMFLLVTLVGGQAAIFGAVSYRRSSIDQFLKSFHLSQLLIVSNTADLSLFGGLTAANLVSYFVICDRAPPRLKMQTDPAARHRQLVYNFNPLWHLQDQIS